MGRAIKRYLKKDIATFHPGGIKAIKLHWREAAKAAEELNPGIGCGRPYRTLSNSI